MLFWSAGRKQRRHTSSILAASFAQLNLPWLAPAQLRWSASHAAATLNPHLSAQPRRRRESKTSQQAKLHVRSLATASEALTTQDGSQRMPPTIGSNPFRNAAQDRNLPWDFSHDSKPRHSNLRPFSDPVIVNNSTRSPAAFEKLASGAHGTTTELLQLLHTTLRVGRITRAEDIIRRLMGRLSPNAPEIVHAHTIYLEEMLRILALAGNGTEKGIQAMRHVQKWFEVQIFQKGIQPSETMLVIMVRAAIRGLSGSQRDRAIRRYAAIARNRGQAEHEEVVFSEDYDDNEFMIIGAATSEYYEDNGEALPEEATTKRKKAGRPSLSETAAKASENALPREDRISLDDIPGVRPTEQKGEGLSSVQRALAAFSKLPALPPDAPLEAQRARAYERERLMEETSVDVALDRWRKEDDDLRKAGISTAMQSKSMGALMFQWYKALMPALEKEKEECNKEFSRLTGKTKGLGTPKESRDSDRLHYGPYLESLPLRKIVATTILTTITFLNSGKSRKTGNYENEAKLAAMTMTLAEAIELESNMDVAKRMRVNKGKSNQELRRAIARQRNEEKKAQGSQLETIKDPYFAWPTHVKVKLGSFLISKLTETAMLPVTREHPRTKDKVTQMLPAFMHRTRYTMGKRTGMIVPNPVLVQKIKNEPLGSVIAKRMPMIVEPQPWTGWSEGGYIHYPSPILRMNKGDLTAMDYFKAADARGDMDQLYAGLTALGRVPWKVNHDVLKVQIDAWNTGEAIANFAPLNPSVQIPPEPNSSADPALRRKWLKIVQAIDSKQAGLHAKRCFQNFQLEIARSYANETLYFPHNMDFRGRAYPIPPYMNHMGADNARAMLVFSEGKELGETGLRWLKIHLANVAGYDKASLQEREDYTMKHLDDIYDSVKNPLGGRRWWLKSEDAWQVLAACHELTKALDSPDPHKFVSHLPIHQDGTCNGLQHYAALGGDEAGAAQVNLEPSDRPADVYTGVLNAVKERIDADVAQGHEIATALQGKLTRKIVKRPVMTNVYGVTFYGARKQVEKEIHELLPEIKPFDHINPGNTAHYITSKIFESLGAMFTGAQAIQHWFGKCADRISTCMTPEQIEQIEGMSKELGARPSLGRGGGFSKNVKPLFKSTIVWTSPLRLPVVQPYRNSAARDIVTSMQKIALHEPGAWDPVSKRKQLQAFPPNFIHSLDATHMIISALKCSELGVAFASIHDSFWTHASDINRLNVVLRDAFVAMHSEDIIGRLKEEFDTRYRGCMYLASVTSNSPTGLEIQKLRKHRQTLPDGHIGELKLEVERLRLLKSDDPKERKKGEAMETPASILTNADESMFLAPREMEGQRLGEIPEGDVGQSTNPDADVLSRTGVEEDEGLADDHPEESPADDFAKANAEDEARAFDEVAEEDMPGYMKERKKAEEKNRMHRVRHPAKVAVWMPVQFPEVPKKGTFDVRRLKESKYFFH